MRHRRLRDKDLAGQPRHMAAVRREHRRIDKAENIHDLLTYLLQLQSKVRQDLG